MSPYGLSLSGSPLRGDRLVRLTYLDDAGLFSYHERFIVIGGVIINADRDMIPVEKRLTELAVKHLPEEDRRGFVFHAQDLWHGGPYFVREKWPLEKRLEILADLAAIPATHNLNLTFGFQDREDVKNAHFPEGISDKQKEISVYNWVFARFCESVEEFMRLFASDEVTLLICEDRDTIRTPLKAVHAVYRDELQIREINPNLTYFPFWHIRDTIHFAKKMESAHLQIADMCTFIVKRRLMHCQHVEPFWKAIKPNLLKLPMDEPQDED